MFCENCGAPLQQKENKLVCPKCGAEFDLTAQNAAAETSSAAAQTAPVSANLPEAPNSASIPTAPASASTNPASKSGDEYITPRGFSSKRNILIIVLAAILVLGLGAGITVIAVTNSPSYKVSQGIQLAERFLSEQNYEQAIIEYEKVLEIEPMNVDAYLGLAETYEKMGDIDKAIEILREGYDQTGDKQIKKKLDELTNPPQSSENSSSSSAPAESSTPEESTPEDLPPYGSMGSVTILGKEYDIATTTELDLSDENLTNQLIVPIGKLVNLKSLNLFHERGSGMYVFNNTNLTDISPLSTLTKLEVLDLRLNAIRDLSPIAGMTNLKVLNLRWNEVSDLTPLENLTNLEQIDLSYNVVKDISPLKNLEKLSVVNMQYNSISDISALANHTNLTSLYLFLNNISDITPLENLTKLTVLNLGDNKITDITPLKNLSNLTTLNLEENQIEDITPLSNLTALVNLYLGGNNISDIKPLANLSKLEKLSFVFMFSKLPLTDEDKSWLREQLPNCEIDF